MGIISNISVIFYDFTLNKEVSNEIDKKYIAETFFFINNFNDLLKLGGFIFIGLGSAYYDKNLSVKKIMELLLFLPLDCHFFSTFSNNIKNIPLYKYKNYKILLSLASLYIIFVLIFSRKIGFLKLNFIYFLF